MIATSEVTPADMSLRAVRLRSEARGALSKLICFALTVGPEIFFRYLVRRNQFVMLLGTNHHAALILLELK